LPRIIKFLVVEFHSGIIRGSAQVKCLRDGGKEKAFALLVSWGYKE